MNEQRALTLAADALRLAISRDYDAAAVVLARIFNECGGEGIYLALMAWCDAFISAILPPGVRPGSVPVGLRFFNPSGGGGLVDIATLSSEEAWAGRLIAARAAMDRATFEALCEALPGGADVHGRHTIMLLLLVASNLRRADQLRALMAAQIERGRDGSL